jgi:hypothetical protein
MRRFIITGAPGAGKTAIIRQLELDGFSVVEEAATDVIAAAQAQGTVEPWRHPSFIDAIADLQRDRQIRGLTNPMRFSFTTGALFHRFLPANLSASRKKQSTNSESSSFATSASSRLPKRGESPLRKWCASRNSRRDLPGLRLRTGLSRARKSGGTGRHDQRGNSLVAARLAAKKRDDSCQVSGHALPFVPGHALPLGSAKGRKSGFGFAFPGKPNS